jgi:hypothetical protein
MLSTLQGVSWRTLLVAVAALLLMTGTVFVFRFFDGHSHSASDTLRPFVITMVPVWALAIGAARNLLREHR